jgi:hypothetical protein
MLVRGPFPVDLCSFRSHAARAETFIVGQRTIKLASFEQLNESKPVLSNLSN